VDTTARAAEEEMCGRREWLALHVDGQVGGPGTAGFTARWDRDTEACVRTDNFCCVRTDRYCCVRPDRYCCVRLDRYCCVTSVRQSRRSARRSEKAVSVLVSHTDVCLPVYGRDGAGLVCLPVYGRDGA